MQITNDIQLDYSDVLIQPKRSTIRSRHDVTITRKFIHDVQAASFEAIPVCAANMSATGTPEMAKILARAGYMCALEKHISAEDIRKLYNDLYALEFNDGVNAYTYSNRVAFSIGTRESLDDLINLIDVIGIPINIVNVDVPNGYIPDLIDRVKEIRARWKDMWIIAGTVVTGDITQDLIMSGANIVRVGIGSGSMCITRLKTGVGRPMISTIAECADAAHQLHGYIMADGGATCAGDICRAFCAGADFIMTGGMFASAEEAGGKAIEIDGKKYKEYFGMSSFKAQKEVFKDMRSYRSSEGREKLIPCTGKLIDILNDISGGLRSCCTYIGSHCLKHMPKHATFYRVNHQLNTIFADCKDI